MECVFHFLVSTLLLIHDHDVQSMNDRMMSCQAFRASWGWFSITGPGVNLSMTRGHVIKPQTGEGKLHM